MVLTKDAAFPSKWLKSSDVHGQVTVTIRNVTMEKVGESDHKPVAWLNEYPKGLVLNNTNWDAIEFIHGPDTDGWVGKQMMLMATMVEFRGQSTLGLRLHPPQSGHQQQAPQSPAQMTNAPLGQGDPRGDVPPAMSENEYGAQRG